MTTTFFSESSPVFVPSTVNEYVTVTDAPTLSAPDHDNAGAAYVTVPAVAVASASYTASSRTPDKSSANDAGLPAV